jgi:glutamate racemase
MNNKQLPIGIFDSGLGGLAVLKQLNKILPKEKFIYFGDTAHVPYGNKSKKTIIKYSKQIVSFLESKKVKLIIVACNTASSTALEILQTRDTPIIDVVAPSIRKAVESTKNKKIGIIATKTTINSGKYQNEIKKINNKIETDSLACPLLVPIIEEALFNHKITQEAINIYLSQIRQDIDTLILGCTHYPLIKKQISSSLKSNIYIVDSSIETAKHVKVFLNKNKLLSNTAKTTATQFYVSDDPLKFSETAKILLNENCDNIKNIELK